MGKSPEHMAWQFVSHSKSLKTAVRPRQAWAQLGIISSFSILNACGIVLFLSVLSGKTTLPFGSASDGMAICQTV